MANKYIAESAGSLQEVEATIASAGAADAGKIVALKGDGTLDPSFFPPDVGGTAVSILASETINAGQFANIWDDAGTTKIRLADASAGLGKMAHGFVKDNVAAGAPGTIFFETQNSNLVGLVPGTSYFLSDTVPGGVTAVAPTTAGSIVQRLGVAYTTTALDFERNQPIVKA